MSGKNGIAFPHYLNRWQRWLWERLPLRLRTRWSPYDNWLRGYTAGFAAGHTPITPSLGTMTDLRAAAQAVVLAATEHTPEIAALNHALAQDHMEGCGVVLGKPCNCGLDVR